MNALDSPLEALALSHLTHGVLAAVNNVLALIAFITSAVSFWKIRATVSPSRSDHPFPPQMFLPPVKVSSPAAAAGPASTPAAAPEREPSCTVEATRGEKFTAYYRDDWAWEEEEERDEDDDGRREVGPSEGWEGVLTLRMGEMGWYRCQDLTALDGSVVRLWDGGVRRRKTASIPQSPWRDNRRGSPSKGRDGRESE